jgi:hypothetical protein
VLYVDRVIENPPIDDTLFAPMQLPKLDEERTASRPEAEAGGAGS